MIVSEKSELRDWKDFAQTENTEVSKCCSVVSASFSDGQI